MSLIKLYREKDPTIEADISIVQLGLENRGYAVTRNDVYAALEHYFDAEYSCNWIAINTEESATSIIDSLLGDDAYLKKYPKYDIWVEGYKILGGEGVGSKLASDIEADSFREACLLFFETEEAKNYKAKIDIEKLTMWGCRLFDNEKEAREQFG